MTKSLKFDFNKAVAVAKRDFPKETAKVDFIHLQDDEHKIPNYTAIAKWFKAEGFIHLEQLFLLQKIASLEAGTIISKNKTQNNIVVVNSEIYKEPIFLKRPRNIKADKYFTFFHELGHALMPENGGTKTSEARSDVFSALYCLKEEVLTTKDVKEISAERAIGAGPIHNTSEALNHLLVEFKDADFISLSPQDIKAIATRYAHDFGGLKKGGRPKPPPPSMAA